MKYLSELIGEHTSSQLFTNISVGVVAVMTYSFGSDPPHALYFLCTLVFIDYFTGVAAAWISKTGLSSKVGFRGIIKKILMFVVVCVAHQMDILLATDSLIMMGTIYFFVSNELISFAENIGRCGLPLPPALRRAITVLKEKGQNEPEIKEDKNKKSK